MSVLTIATVGFTFTSMALPLMFFYQLARGLTPTQAALLLPAGGGADFGAVGQLPAQIAAPFAESMSQTILLPAAAMVVGLVSVLFLRRPAHLPTPR